MICDFLVSGLFGPCCSAFLCFGCGISEREKEKKRKKGKKGKGKKRKKESGCTCWTLRGWGGCAIFFFSVCCALFVLFFLSPSNSTKSPSDRVGPFTLQQIPGKVSNLRSDDLIFSVSNQKKKKKKVLLAFTRIFLERCRRSWS